MIITHFTSRTLWHRALEVGTYATESLEKERFIHCSTLAQVVQVANFIAKDSEDLVLLWIDEDRVESKIIYENLEGGERLFPHIYGALNLNAVVKVSDFTKNEKGEYMLPA